MIKMSRKAKKAMAVALTAGMLASTAATPVMAATEGWKKNSTGWWYQNADGSWPANKWEKINGSWYYFDANGYMKANSWAQDSSGKWYYLGVNGAMKTNSWAQDKAGLWYFVGADGAMVTNTWKTDKEGLWYHLGADGAMEAGKWITVGGKNYFLDADGVMQSGVIRVDGKTYYLGEANDGSMQTGTINIEGVNYTFDEQNGNCTSEKLPTTTKRFDGKGNLIEDTIDIEEIDGVTAEVVNALPQYKDYGNVIMAGSDVTLKVKVTNNGEPVVGTYVTLDLKCENATALDPAQYQQTTYVSQTGTGGYATFVIAAKDGVTPTTGSAQYYTYTVTSAINDAEATEGNFAIAKMNIPIIDVNPTGANDKLEMSDNATEDDTCEVTTTAMDGKTKIAYVKSQQVSLPNQTDHKVTFEIKPEIWIPTGKIKEITSDFSKDVNQSISEYSVYETQEFWIEDIPAGLQYTTVHFENIDISEHTKVEIQAFDQDTKSTALSDLVTLEGPTPTTQKNLGQQLPITNEEKPVAIKVKVISAGQVNDDQNGGLTVKDVTGVYKQKGTVEVEKIPYTDPVTWEQTKIEYSLAQKMSLEDAGNYITDGTYLNENYEYSYQVPVFPYVGNAVITVKDNNKKEIAFYTVPTVNQGDGTKYKNVNVLDESAAGEAILVTKDEAFNSVGTITPNGNRVTVNSSETGVTAFKAKITIDGKELDLTNDTINTSVHWSPLPSVAQQNDFYALSGQTITVKAQLVDKAGNKVSKANEAISFSANGTPIAEGDIDGTMVTAMQIAEMTDTEGCAKLVVQATDTQALLAALTADSKNKNYDVVLHIGEEKVETANLRWVTPGLTFTPTAVDIATKDLVLADVENPSDMLDTLDDDFTGEVSEAYATRYLTKDAGSNWILGFNANGDTQDEEGKERWVSSIEGLKINISQDGEATLVTDGMKNGSAKVSSTKANGVEITGEIDETSVVAGTDIIFTVKTKVGTVTTTKPYKNVGEGEPVFEDEVALTLPVLFGTVGTKVSIELPKGDSIDTLADEVVYVKVLDAFDNAKEGKLKKVTITYTDVNGDRITKVYDEENSDVTGPAGVALAAINSDGYVEVEVLREVAGVKVKKAEIKAEYDNQSDTKTINFVDAKGDEFMLLNANYDDANKQATLNFSQNVSNLKSEMIKVTNDSTGNNVGISKVEVKNGNKVVITFKNALKDDYNYTVRVVDGVDINEDGIVDTLCDKYGRELEVKEAVLKVEAEDLAPTYNAGKISFKINGTTGTSDQKILCVWDGGHGVVDGNGTLAVDTAITNKEVTEVKCYYGGAVKTVTLEDRVAGIKAAKDALKDQDFSITVADYASDSGAVAPSITDFSTTITVTENTPDGDIFADGGTSLAFADSKNTNKADSATVEIEYTHDTYSSVTKTVTYKVTLVDTDSNDIADKIVFTQQ